MRSIRTIVFTPSEVNQLRRLIQTEAHGRLGTLYEQHRIFDRVRGRLERRTGLMMIPETFMVRLFPNEDEGLAAHVDLDFILQHVQDPTTCLVCGRQSTTRGLHWTPACRKPPRDASMVTIVVNMSSDSGSIVSLGPECRVAKNATGGIIPVVATGRCIPVNLQPGEAIQFSPWTVNEYSSSSLDGTHVSLHVCAYAEGPPRPAVFFPYFPYSQAHSRTNEPENHRRITYIYEGLVRWGITSTRIVPSHVPEAIQRDVLAAIRVVHPDEDLQLGFGDSDSYSVGPATRVAATAALVTSCMTVHHASIYHVPVFAAVRPPGHHARRTTSAGFCWRNNTLVAAVYAASRLSSVSGLKRVCIFDPDFHHGLGLQYILENRTFKQYCTSNNLFILYFSVYRKGTFDSTVCETSTAVNSERSGTQTIRLYSSGRGICTTERLGVIQQVLLESTRGFDHLVVAAGFDHCVGENMEMRNLYKALPLWTENQMVGLGNCIRATAKQTTTGHCTAILEGGYEKSTLTSIVPAFLHAIGIPARPPPSSSLSSSSLSSSSYVEEEEKEDDDVTDTESDDDVAKYVQTILS